MWHHSLLTRSDVCLEAEASPRDSIEAALRQPRGGKSAASAAPRRFDASLRSCNGLNVRTYELRYDIIIHYFHSFIFCIYACKIFKIELHLRTQ